MASSIVHHEETLKQVAAKAVIFHLLNARGINLDRNILVHLSSVKLAGLNEFASNLAEDFLILDCKALETSLAHKLERAAVIEELLVWGATLPYMSKYFELSPSQVRDLKDRHGIVSRYSAKPIIDDDIPYYVSSYRALLDNYNNDDIYAKEKSLLVLCKRQRVRFSALEFIRNGNL